MCLGRGNVVACLTVCIVTLFALSWGGGGWKYSIYSHRINSLCRHWLLLFLTRWLVFSSVSHPQVQVFKLSMSLGSTGVCFAVVNQYFPLQNTSRVILPQVNSFSGKTHSGMLQGLYLKIKQKSVLLVRCESIFMSTTAERKLAEKKKKRTGLKCTNHSKTFSKTFYHVHMVDSKLLDSFWCDFLSLVKCTVRLSWTHPHPFPVCVRFLPCPLWKDRMMARLSS